MSMYLLDKQLAWIMRNGYCTWHCFRCIQTLQTATSMYYHLVDFHGLEPDQAMKDDIEDPNNPWNQPTRDKLR